VSEFVIPRVERVRVGVFAGEIHIQQDWINDEPSIVVIPPEYAKALCAAIRSAAKEAREG
jgi:hypothetical protein